MYFQLMTFLDRFLTPLRLPGTHELYSEFSTQHFDVQQNFEYQITDKSLINQGVFDGPLLYEA